MFRSVLFATAMVAVEAWKQDYNSQIQGYGADNQHYGHQGGYNSGRVDAHNSKRTGGHQGQGHNQWVDNAWNQWGTNNHWDTQKSVDNKWGNNSGKINVTLNSVNGHYDEDYGQQRRGIGYEGHQNTSGDVGYVIGLAGHSFGYAPGNHSYGYKNKKDHGYGGWANNLGAWNHGANYDNFGNQHKDDRSLVANAARDSANVKRVRRVGGGYADYDELEDSDHGSQYGRKRAPVSFGGNTKVGSYGGLSKGNTAFSSKSYGGNSNGGSIGGNLGGGYGGSGYGGSGYGGSSLGSLSPIGSIAGGSRGGSRGGVGSGFGSFGNTAKGGFGRRGGFGGGLARSRALGRGRTGGFGGRYGGGLGGVGSIGKGRTGLSVASISGGLGGVGSIGGGAKGIGGLSSNGLGGIGGRGIGGRKSGGFRGFGGSTGGRYGGSKGKW